MYIELSHPNQIIAGDITLDGSKSISNRALIIQALMPEKAALTKLSTSQDTNTLKRLLAQKETAFDAGAAGTTFRFMTALLALREGTQILTGSERMKKRPIKILVDALTQLGANIEYLETPGFPPLKINTPDKITQNRLSIPADTSSQYITALLLIAPTLDNGLELTLEGEIVSLPYIEMTLNLMAHFGVETKFENNVIKVSKQTYQSKPLVVEADWSAASYYYIIAGFAEHLNLQLKGLFKQSVQGDAVIQKIGIEFGIHTQFTEEGIRLSKIPGFEVGRQKIDFIHCPDIAQSVAVLAAPLAPLLRMTGLQTLRIKETDRILALQQELDKIGCTLVEKEDAWFELTGTAKIEHPTFETYEDHRMAMAFAPLAMYDKVRIMNPNVVEKSYPNFWRDLGRLGFKQKWEH